MANLGPLPFNLQNNTLADATQVDANFNQIINAATSNAAASGANTDITSLGGLTTPLSAGQGGTILWTGGTSTGTANAQVVATVTPSTGFSLTQNRGILFTAGFTNTGPTTLNIFGTGATNVFRTSPSGPQALTGGEIVAGNLCLVVFDGTQYELLNVQTPFGGFGPLVNIASAATTDLGTVAGHNANITGTTTITSFGASASTTYPWYRVTFAGILTLTQNATSLILPGGTNIVTAAGDTAELLYLGSGNWQVTDYTPASGLTVVVAPQPGYLFGNILSGGGSQTLTINSGLASSDDAALASLVSMNLSSTYTKTFANWAAGSGNGGLDTGTIANNTWYHVFIIKRTDTGIVDVLISLSATSPTMPANYTKKRRVGALKTDATPNIIPFTQHGDEFAWSTLPALDTSATLSTGSRSLIGTQVPTNVIVRWFGSLQSTTAVLITDPANADSSPANAATPLATLNNQNASGVAVTAYQWTNTSAQIGVRGASAVTCYVQTYGWTDLRGKQN